MARFLVVEDNNELGSLMVATAKAWGHEGVHARTGAEAKALLGKDPFAFAIVDLHLEDISGGELLGVLQQEGVPSIAVSGVYKGDRYAQEAVNVYGAKAFFEKPFTMSVLLEAAEKAAGIFKPAAPAPSDDALEELEELAPIAEEDEDAAYTVDVATEDELDTLRVRLPFAERDKVWGKTPESKSAAPKPVPQWAQTGSLAETSVPRLLGAYYQARHTGELKLRQGSVLKVVFFEAGRPAYAASNLVAERFARFCVKKGVLSENDMGAVAQLAQEQKLRTGEAMQKLGLIEPEARKKLLEEQVKEIIWSTFTWTKGDYSFAMQRPSRSDLVKLSIFPGDLVVEGIDRTLPLVTLRQKMGAERKLIPSADPPYALHELKLSGAQAMLLAYCDGTKSVSDLVALTDLSEREALAALLAFELMGLVEPVRESKRARVSYGL